MSNPDTLRPTHPREPGVEAAGSAALPLCLAFVTPVFPVRGSIRALAWSVALLIVAPFVWAVGSGGARAALVIGAVVAILLGERYIRALRSRAPIRLVDDVLELPVRGGLARVGLGELERVELIDGGLTSRLVIEARPHVGLYLVSELEGGRAAAEGLVGALEGRIAAVAPERLESLRARAARAARLRSVVPGVSMLLASALALGFALQLLGRSVPGLGKALGGVAGSWVDAPWQLLTSHFLQRSGLHLYVHLGLLWTIGCTLERILGLARYAASIGFAALAGALLSALALGEVARGASAIVAGLAGGAIVVGYRLRHELPAEQRPDLRLLVMLLLLELLLLLPSPRLDGVSMLGGLAVGLVTCGLWVPRTLDTSSRACRADADVRGTR